MSKWSKERRQQWTEQGNPMYKEQPKRRHSGNQRAQRRYLLQPCEVCGATKNVERHHIDDDTTNNEPENIQFLCRKHHMEVDGRTAAFKEREHERIRDSKGRYVSKEKGCDYHPKKNK